MRLWNWIRSKAALALLAGAYGVALLLSRFSRRVASRSGRGTGRALAMATFDNPGWFRSHIGPLARSGLSELILVTDQPEAPMPHVRFVCPPAWLTRVFGRAGAKFLCVLFDGLRHKPDLYMGYHISPAGWVALVAGSLFARPACYQMTGGPVQVAGGGVYSEGRLARVLERPSAWLERLGLALVREFDLVVVRGPKARRFLLRSGVERNVAIVTGSVMSELKPKPTQRIVDLAFVGRFAPVKQPIRFVEIAAGVNRKLGSVRAAMVGDGPLMEPVQARARELGLQDCVEFSGSVADARPILRQSKVFVLTSRSEGLSIAMLEAMAAGAVPVVADVGELGGFLGGAGGCGYAVEPDELAAYVERIVALLQDRRHWGRLSRAAAKKVRDCCDSSVIEAKWHRLFLRLGVLDPAQVGLEENPASVARTEAFCTTPARAGSARRPYSARPGRARRSATRDCHPGKVLRA